MAENSRKSFRKSVRNVAKKLFSKNKDEKNKDEKNKDEKNKDEKFEKQKEELLKKIEEFKKDKKLIEIIEKNPTNSAVIGFRRNLSLENNETVDDLLNKIDNCQTREELEKLNLESRRIESAKGDVDYLKEKFSYERISKDEFLKKINEFRENKILMGIIENNPKSVIVKNFRKRLSLKGKETVDDLYEKISKCENYDEELEKLNFNFKNLKFAEDDAKYLKRKYDDAVEGMNYKFSSKDIEEYELKIKENQKKIKEAFKECKEEYIVKCREFNKAKELRETYMENICNVFKIETTLHNNILNNLKEKFKNKKEFDELKEEIENIINKEFPRCLFENPDFIKAKAQFDKRYSELKEEKLMEDFRGLFELEKKRLNGFKEVIYDLQKSGTNVRQMAKDIENNEKSMESIKNCNNPTKIAQKTQQIEQENNELEKDIMKLCKDDKTNKGKSRLKRLKDWSKKFSKKLKIKKNKSKSKK